MTNIEKFKIDEKIRLSYIKHRGDVIKVSEETGYELTYVKKVTTKMRKRQDKEVGYYIANSLMSYILMGHEQRIRHLLDSLELMEGRYQELRSVCCKALVSTFIRGEKHKVTYHICTACNNRCEVETKTLLNLLKMRNNIIKLIQEEDEYLVDFAEKLGYTNKEEQPSPIVKQNILVMNPKNKNTLDQSVISELESLSPMDRQKARKALEAKIAEESQGEVSK